MFFFIVVFAPRGVFCLSYPNDALSDDIDALITGADALSAAADSIATIVSGSDVVVSNFDHVEAVFDNLQALLGELKSGHFYCPVGMVSPFAGGSAYVPSGWLLCNGQAFGASGAGVGPVSADLEAMLVAAGFAAVPDLRGRVIAGVDSTGLTDINAHPTRLRPVSAGAATLGSVVGDSRLQSHTHTQQGTFTSSWHGGHIHNINSRANNTSATPWNAALTGANLGPNDQIINSGGAHDHTTTISGATTEHNQSVGSAANVQPTIVLNYIIKN